MAMTSLTTTRLRLDPFEDGHLAGLNTLNSDLEVMRYLSGRAESLDETKASIATVKKRWNDVGYSWWAFIEHETGELVGAGALQNLRRDASPSPDLTCPLELGWRLRRDRWGRGLATEAGQVIGRHAFEVLHVRELFAVCDPANSASANVMKRLGMENLGVQRWYGKDSLTYRTTFDRWPADRGARGANAC